MTTAPDNRVRHLRCGADTRMRPDYGILDARAFFYKARLAQNRINDLSPRLNLAIVTDNRQVINLCYGGGIKRSATFLDMDSANLIGKQIMMGLEVALRRANIYPVGARWNVSEKFFLSF